MPAVQSTIAACMPEGYGYVVFTAVGSTFVNMWMAINVGKARKKFDIKYPIMYSPDNQEFNCIQRAHQNTLEGYPTFLMLLFVGGLQYPKVSAGAGVVYLLGRIMYAKGYYTGDPKKRSRGTFAYLGSLTLLGSSIMFACNQLGWCENCSWYPEKRRWGGFAYIGLITLLGNTVGFATRQLGWFCGGHACC